MKSFASVLLCICFTQKVLSIEHDFKGFDDSILFGVNWPGPIGNFDYHDENNDSITRQKKEIVKVKTSNKELYECHIPEVIVNDPYNVADYAGPSPLQLLKPLFVQKICSYRLESYWSYEVCHGRYIRQYHEEREGKQVKTQEYYLGQWSLEKQKAMTEDLETNKETETKPRLTKVDGLALPYVELVMDDGTLCDLNNKPRVTRVLYVCYSHGKHEVYAFKETSTCEYEIIILSPLLCEHPEFKPKEANENIISCMPLAGAPDKPKSLLEMEAESLKLKQQVVAFPDRKAKDVLAVLKVEKIGKDGEPHLKLELHPIGDIDVSKDANVVPDNSFAISDDSPVRAFLNGDNCLNGGTGWWKYEFCYGKYVSQYHIDRSGEKTTVKLGTFDEDAHLEWIRDNKAKAPKPVDQRTSISLLYADGDICDKTGKPRQTEVKLKCLENSSHSAQVSLYLLEPRTCNYILGVESPLICDILPLADENGLIKISKPFQMAHELPTDSDDNEYLDNNKNILDIEND